MKTITQSRSIVRFIIRLIFATIVGVFVWRIIVMLFAGIIGDGINMVGIFIGAFLGIITYRVVEGLEEKNILRELIIAYFKAPHGSNKGKKALEKIRELEDPRETRKRKRSDGR